MFFMGMILKIGGAVPYTGLLMMECANHACTSGAGQAVRRQYNAVESKNVALRQNCNSVVVLIVLQPQ
jgi:hypothetical protein